MRSYGSARAEPSSRTSSAQRYHPSGVARVNASFGFTLRNRSASAAAASSVTGSCRATVAPVRIGAWGGDRSSGSRIAGVSTTRPAVP